MLALSWLCSFSQRNEKKDSVEAFKIKILNTDYKDFQVVKKKVYAITKGGTLVVFDLKKDKIISIEGNVLAITKNKMNEIYYINDEKEIKNTFSEIKEKINFDFKCYRILLDNKNNTLLISNKGILYKNKIFCPTQIKHHQKYYNYKTKDFENPDLIYLDSKNRLWLTYDRGEFGYYLLFFDIEKKVFFEEDYLSVDVDIETFTNKEKYFPLLQKEFPDKIKIKDKDTLYNFPHQLPISKPIRGIAEKGNRIFISQSLIHFFVYSSFSVIEKEDADGFYKKYYITENLIEFTKNIKNSKFAKEFLGPVQFNPFNNSLYYYTDKGFFKIIENENKFEREFIFKPWIFWTYSNRYNLGADINVTKFEFISENEIIFLTTNNGIGYFNGKTVKYYK